MTKSQVSPVASVVKQSKLRRGRNRDVPKVVDLHPRVSLTQSSLVVTNNENESYDLSNLLCQRELAILLATGLARYSETVRTRTSFQCAMDLNNPISQFLKGFSKDINPSKIDESFWTSFIRYLNAPRNRGEPWAVKTRLNYFSSFKACIRALLGDAEYDKTARYLLDQSGFPFNPWPGSATKSTPIETLRSHELDAIIEACLGDLERLRCRVSRNQDSLASVQSWLEGTPPQEIETNYQNIYECAAAVVREFPNKLPTQKLIREKNHALGRAVQYIHGINAVKSILYNHFRDLVPFVLLLTLKTGNNPNSVLGLTWSQVQNIPDSQGIRIAASKHRSSSQVELIPAEEGVLGGASDIFDLLAKLTQGTRRIAKCEDRDKLFIGVPRARSKSAKGFARSGSKTGDPAWDHSLASFINSHSLPQFSLKTLRPSAVEALYEQGGDSFDVKEKLGHRSLQTQFTHYTSDRVRRLARDKLAATQSQIVHWIETSGQVDPRGRKKWDRHSTTRGFLCLDPRQSPRNGQKNGRLCTAYAECPSCPLMGALPGDDYAVACYLALKDQIYHAKQRSITGLSWLNKWKPILQDLERIIELSPREVVQRASQLSVHLPPVG